MRIIFVLSKKEIEADRLFYEDVGVEYIALSMAMRYLTIIDHFTIDNLDYKDKVKVYKGRLFDIRGVVIFLYDLELHNDKVVLRLFDA